MRKSVVVSIIGLGLLLAPVGVMAKPQHQRTNSQQCRRMTKQIGHYENVVLKMAEDRGNALWANATTEQISRLKNRRADVCPEYGKERSALRKAVDKIRKGQKIMAEAAKGAAKYFSGGLW